jgi:hypothetical protein
LKDLNLHKDRMENFKSHPDVFSLQNNKQNTAGLETAFPAALHFIAFKNIRAETRLLLEV